MKILVLGASGMLGNAMIRVLSEKSDLQVYGTVRSESSKIFFSAD
jgi:dTDP-4-dehydrorhamnose reductase